MSAPTPSLDNALARWRSNLIDLSRRNPLLALKPTRSSLLVLTAPDVAQIFDTLVNTSKSWSFWLPPVEETKVESEHGGLTPRGSPASAETKPTELVTGEQDRQRLVQILTNLYRRALADFRERGLHVLHLAAGILDWRDSDDQPLRSPLILVPVELKRKSLQEPFSLEAIDEDPFINPALEARLLQDFEFRLPPAPEHWEDNALATYFAAVDSAVAGLPGWKLERDALLSLFSFFKGVIFQDLADNAERAKAHPLVQALAGAPTSFKKVESPTEAELDEKEDPAQTFHILDADGSQRVCLEAAVRGESFVLIGPPGTGKSQTIANLIADRIAQGKRILFVSEKMAALEVVFQRLRHVGLSDFCLEVHSHKASKREVVTELARVYQERSKSAGAGEPDDPARLKHRRDQLNRYVQALHAVREPLRRSAWAALAELPMWNHLPAMPLGLPLATKTGEAATAKTILEITPGQFDEMTHLCQRASQLWQIREDAHYPWRGFKADRFTLGLRDEVVGLIDKIRKALDRLKSVADQYASKLDVKASVAWLLKTGDLLDHRPNNIPAAWLRASDLPQVSEDLNRCADQYQRLGQARAPLTARYGPGLWLMADGLSAKVEDAWKNARKWLAPGDEKGAGLLTHQQKLRGWAADTMRRVPGWLTEIRALEKWLAVPLPLGAGADTSAKPATPGESRLDPSPHSIRQFIRIAHLCMADNAPERSWVLDPKMLDEARNLVARHKPTYAVYHERRKRLLQTYKDSFFELELERIATGYSGPYLSWFRIFNGQFRQDRRSIKRRTHKFEVPETVAEDVALGRDVMVDKTRLDAEMAQRQTIIGRYEKGMDTDWEATERATRIATEAVQIAHDLGCIDLPARFVDALCATSPPQEKIRAAFKRLNESFGPWQHSTDELKAVLPMDSLPQVGEALDDSASTALVNYCRELQTAMNQFAGLTDPVLVKAPAVPPDAATLVADLHQAEELRAWEASQQTESERWQTRFGTGFQGIDTDWESLRRTLSWVRRVREAWGQLKSVAGAEALRSPGEAGVRGFEDSAPATQMPDSVVNLLTAKEPPPSVRDLKQAEELYEHALAVFEHRFDSPGPLLEGKRYLEHPPELVHQHLGTLRDRVGELSDWIDFRLFGERFMSMGLGAFWQAINKEPPPREQLVDVFQRAFWSAWIEAVFQSDLVLTGFRRGDHERVLAEFRDLDRGLIRQGAARVASGALKQNQLGSLEGETALLMKEAHKKTRHWPLRRLFDAIPNLLLELKPCLLMSPLSVSQFLPSDPDKTKFDLIVFDEASQILPEDAVGAIYRGAQVVITGDNQQLPPTTFFQQFADDGEDGPSDEEMPLFESILDACLGAGMPRQVLRWHYRSQHEHLIAFSNQRFYEGRLVTFPAPLATSPHLGVKFVPVANGVYDRGGRRDNPREAEAVAELVLDHFRQSPEKSLGVIAFSYPQMGAIQDEIDRRLRQFPDLERFFQGDRLEGFFVKNLETVQGDERDVILLSVGYGRDKSGKLALNFGPLNREGGERRLNVAVTRARQKLVLVSSIRARDLDGAESNAAGVTNLLAYLDFAERGIESLQLDEPDEKTQMSGLTGEVIDELQKMGYKSIPQVGCGSYRIDLGVVDPKDPGAFLLGIEFDGVNYRQAATARDRDRLRPEVLQQLGWKLHRIWSPDWLYRRHEEVERLAKILQPRSTP
ncbi:MAG: DUF4011 domain-containing protein [Planctomycetes bacterium]|nr:DUF4011 domain-containing protein [Planctomycetota bacterium]